MRNELSGTGQQWHVHFLIQYVQRMLKNLKDAVLLEVISSLQSRILSLSLLLNLRRVATVVYLSHFNFTHYTGKVIGGKH